jgi:hypothetical protein
LNDPIARIVGINLAVCEPFDHVIGRRDPGCLTL